MRWKSAGLFRKTAGQHLPKLGRKGNSDRWYIWHICSTSPMCILSVSCQILDRPLHLLSNPPFSLNLKWFKILELLLRREKARLVCPTPPIILHHSDTYHAHSYVPNQTAGGDLNTQFLTSDPIFTWDKVMQGRTIWTFFVFPSYTASKPLKCFLGILGGGNDIPSIPLKWLQLSSYFSKYFNKRETPQVIFNPSNQYYFSFNFSQITGNPFDFFFEG